MQQLIARSPQQSQEPVVVFANVLVSPGMSLLVGESDAAVFVKDGWVAGAVGPGQHALDPNSMPLLWNFRDASGQIVGSVVLVTMALLPGRWSLTQGDIKAFGEARYRVADPATLARQGGADPAALLRHALAGEITQRALGRALNEALGAGWQVQHLAADSTRLAELGRQYANAELSTYGIELVELSSVSISSGAQPEPPPPAARSGPAVYEMLWDCRHCGTKKLLGKTHRCCPNCGSPQDVQARYFPSDSEKVALHDHVYYGADRVCRYCQNGNSRNNKHCGNCGAPLDEGSDVQRRGDQVHAIGAYAGERADDARRELSGVAKPPPPAPKKVSWKLILGGIAGCFVLAFLGLVVLALVWTKPTGLTVAGHAWKREIDVERFGPVEETAWCDSVPSGAVVKGRSRAVRSHEQVQKGEKCSMRKSDNGDGTFSESRECEPVYEDKPVYDSECRYVIDKWSKNRTLTASGSALSDEPKWPEVALAQTGQCLGCEREGKRHESYSVSFVDPQTKDKSSCSFDQAKWQGFKPGSQWVGEVGVIGGILSCGSLKPR